jgi:hypothetical protein
MVASDPALRALGEKMKMFLRAPWHPKPGDIGQARTEVQKEGFYADYTEKEIHHRFEDLFLAAWLEHVSPPSPEDREKQKESFVRDLVGWDYNRAQGRLMTDDPARKEHRAMNGISFLCKYALSKDAMQAQTRFPQEMRDIWNAAADHLRAEARKGNVDENLKVLIKMWQEDTGEEIVLV